MLYRIVSRNKKMRTTFGGRERATRTDGDKTVRSEMRPFKAQNKVLYPGNTPPKPDSDYPVLFAVRLHVRSGNG